ncbi:MAG TPA: hypothetical protein VGD15_05600 [Kribbella sp.]
MRQVRVTKVTRTKSSRERQDAVLRALPPDLRDPDIVRAKQLQRDGQRGGRAQ